jgi:CheY-like chemotaxis protein
MPQESSPKAITAIVIDDKWLTANSLIKILDLFNISAQHASSARDGVIMMRTKRPDMIFLDIHMPGVDGLEFLKYIRQLPGFNTLPIFIVTSDDQPETAEKARSLGVADVMIKPVMIDTLEAALLNANLIKPPA